MNNNEINNNELDFRVILGSIDEVNIGPLNSNFLIKPISTLSPSDPVLVKEDTKIKDIIPYFQNHKCDCVFVINEDEKMIGIYTARDLVMKSLKDEEFLENEVSKYMTRKVISGKMDSTIAYVLNILSIGGFTQFPIIDEEGYPISLISLRDILDYIVNASIKPLLEA